jgi:flagellar basal-body rod modification protein FlgD
MSISAVTSSSSTSSSDKETVSSSSTSSNLKIEFIDLLVAQIQNQDPTDPIDSSTYVSQLSQLSMVQSLEELSSLQTSSNDLVEDLTALQSTNLVGQHVLAKSSTATLNADGSLSGQVTLGSAADSLTINVYDANGTLISSETSSSPSAGTYSFSFDDLKAGTYTVTAVSSANSTNTNQTTYLNSEVESVTLNDDGVQLKVSGGGTVALDDVLAVSKT